MAGRFRVEWQTLTMLAICYATWGAALFLPAILAIPLAALAIALHSSLTHEAIHGHPTRHRWLNEALVWPALSLIVPFARFRDTHMAHHFDARLTDPYDDPESNYLDPAVWARFPAALRALLRFNNTLVGRVILGPVLGTAFWLRGDLALVRAGDRRVIRGWLAHLPAAAAVLFVVAVAPISLAAYLAAIWVGLGLIRIRTFLEHQAHDRAEGRTAVVEDRGLLSLLFLNNNLHAVHHRHPSVPWYDLPALYRAGREEFLDRNGGYRFGSYGEILRAYLFRAKDPVPHPLFPAQDG